MAASPSAPQPKVLSLTSINPHVLSAQYAVRGLIPQRAEQLRAKISAGQGADLPFEDVIFANIGNPQQLDQKPLTFFRQVASLLEYPDLLDHEEALKGLGYPADVVERARRLLKEVKSVGAYSNSAGAPGIKKSVAEFIERRSFSVCLSPQPDAACRWQCARLHNLHPCLFTSFTPLLSIYGIYAVHVLYRANGLYTGNVCYTIIIFHSIAVLYIVSFLYTIHAL
jgi:hypothetical protein